LLVKVNRSRIFIERPSSGRQGVGARVRANIKRARNAEESASCTLAAPVDAMRLERLDVTSVEESFLGGPFRIEGGAKGSAHDTAVCCFADKSMRD